MGFPHAASFQEEIMRYAVIDTGSNTIRMGIYEEENGILKQIYNHAVFANLAGYMEQGALSQAGIQAAEDAILLHLETAATYSCMPRVFATAAIRNAKNTKEICTQIQDTCHISLDVLTGEEEALYSFYGAFCDFPCQDGVMTDVGGGSSEIIAFSQKIPTTAQSVPWGSLKTYNTFVKGTVPTKTEIAAIQDAINNSLAQTDAFCNKTCQNLCIVGGGVRASGKLAEAILHQKKLSVQAITDMISFAVDSPAEMTKLLQQLVPERAKTIVPAMAIYAAVGRFFHAEDIFVSDKGIKEGYILKKMIENSI